MNVPDDDPPAEPPPPDSPPEPPEGTTTVYDPPLPSVASTCVCEVSDRRCTVAVPVL